ncbi:DUF202 domain-containing protein [Pantoea sp. BAV 3049]|uniref:DUF202 domain-containing protein n=1 Tax=Pantoea sp. BAV 3049 TaxID=2654188 RepID=UPI00131E5344|nr:DUF202 domain-containing protein [Pantoea sp. BAV 3049]
MPAKRHARRLADPGLQPERTSLAWFRTLLGCGVLMALALRHHRELSGPPFWSVMAVLIGIWLMLCGYTRQRGRMDIAHDFTGWPARMAKLGIALAVLLLALLFCCRHLLQLLSGGLR